MAAERRRTVGAKKIHDKKRCLKFWGPRGGGLTPIEALKRDEFRLGTLKEETGLAAENERTNEFGRRKEFGNESNLREGG